jgi:hypothetical protein
VKSEGVNLMNLRAALVCATAALLIAGCSGQRVADETKIADDVTRSVYNNDYAGTVKNFDDTLKGQVTRGQVGVISDKLHALGDYQGLTEVKSEPDYRRYTFEAKLTNGTATVRMRVHADGTIAAYRVEVPAATIFPTPASTASAKSK